MAAENYMQSKIEELKREVKNTCGDDVSIDINVIFDLSHRQF